MILENKERENELSKIKRYTHSLFPIMFYRTNDLIHAKRVRGHLWEAIPDLRSIYGNKFDVEYALVAAEVHDDLEMITGDFQLHDKEKMTPTELEELSKNEKNAIPLLIERYGKNINGFLYEDLLLSTKNKNKLETQFISFFDKFDGAGESWHEIWAGNPYFVLPAGGRDGKSGGYIRRLNEFPKKYPFMEEFFKQFPEYLPKPFDFNLISKNGKPHSKESLQKNSNYPLYELWKKSVIKTEGIQNIITQIEFLK